MEQHATNTVIDMMIDSLRPLYTGRIERTALPTVARRAWLSTGSILHRSILNKCRRQHVVFIDNLMIAGGSSVLARYLRLGGQVFSFYGLAAINGFFISFAMAGLIFRTSGIYRGMWRYASLHDLMTVVKSGTLVVLISWPFTFAADRLAGLPRSVPIIQRFVLVMLL
jgi:hypothetical protein